jgi:hypothetical protein
MTRINTKFYMSILFGLLLVASITLVDAQNRDDQRGMPHDHMRGIHPPMLGDRDFQGGSQSLNISGEITIGDGIILTLTIRPNDEALELMNQRMEQMRHNQRDIPHQSDMYNQINLTLYSLIEFIDNGDDGYDPNDTIVSVYELNNESLNPIEKQTSLDNTTYVVSSIDDVFRMYIYVNTTNDLPHDWKWSVEINYPFTQNDTKLAMLHEIETYNHHLSHRRGYDQAPMDSAQTHRYQNNSRVDTYGMLAMRFQWDDFAVIDGEIENVKATSTNSFFALSMPQGEHIFYDPSIGVDPESINQLENTLEEFFANGFLGMLNPPIYWQLLIAISMVLIIIRIAYVSRQRMKSGYN